MWQTTQFFPGVFVVKLKGVTGSSPSCTSRRAKSMERRWTRAGVPVLNRRRGLCSSFKEADRAVAVSREYFVPRGMFENELYPGIPELLAATAAAGRVNVIATSKPQPFAERIAAHFGIDRHFRLLSGSTFDGRRKTKADVIRHALSALGIAPDEAVMIGDRRHDVEGAAEEGLPAIAVEWGYAPPGELEAARPLRIVPDVETLRRLLLGNE